MLVKLIICRVHAGSRAAFSSAQARWSALENEGGFLGQIGGWADPGAPEPSDQNMRIAVVIGLWRDRPSCQAFMSGAHDTIGAGQAGTYQSSNTEVLGVIDRIDPGSAPPRLGAGGGIRVADCIVRPGRAGSFEQSQRDLWNPGMRGAPGFGWGVVARAGDRYVVASWWVTVEAHRSYRDDRFGALRERSLAGDDTASIDGWFAPIEPAWVVRPTGRAGSPAE